jgi:transketolase
MEIAELKTIKRACVRTLLALYKKANAGHIGASLSCLDMLIYLFFLAMDRNDRFLLSKGHAALGLYTVLAASGRIDPALLNEFYMDGTVLAAHPPCNRQIPDIPFGTGSLGHGLPLATGMALAGRYTGVSRQIYCIVSEGDLNEGSTWEAMLFAAHHRLDNLVMMVDRNNLQGFGSSEMVLGLDDLAAKIRSFNFDLTIADNGNDFDSLDSAFRQLHARSGRPKCLLAKTTKGHGVSFMENKMEWHYLPMNDEQYQQALLELDQIDA